MHKLLTTDKHITLTVSSVASASAASAAVSPAVVLACSFLLAGLTAALSLFEDTVPVAVDGTEDAEFPVTVDVVGGAAAAALVAALAGEAPDVQETEMSSG